MRQGPTASAMSAEGLSAPTDSPRHDADAFRVWGLGSRVKGLGFRDQGLRFIVQGLGFRV